MNSSSPFDPIDRRRFFQRSAAIAGAFGVSSSLRAGVAASIGGNAFEYSVDRFRKVDPALIGYEAVRRFKIGADNPRRIALGPDGTIHVAAGKAVLKTNEAGEIVSRIALAGEARSLSVSNEGEVYVGVSDHVEVFDEEGTRMAVWDAPKGRALITGVAVGREDVFLADAGNRIVWRHDRAGRLKHRIGDKNLERGIPGFIVPSPFFDVEIGADGLLRVANTGRHRVETYTVDGDLEFSWGRAGAAIANFCGCCNPINIELLPDGGVITFEKGLARVKVYSAQGELSNVVAGPEAFADPTKRKCEFADCSLGGLDGAVDAKGNVHVLDLITGEVQVFQKKKTV